MTSNPSSPIFALKRFASVAVAGFVSATLLAACSRFTTADPRQRRWRTDGGARCGGDGRSVDSQGPPATSSRRSLSCSGPHHSMPATAASSPLGARQASAEAVTANVDYLKRWSSSSPNHCRWSRGVEGPGQQRCRRPLAGPWCRRGGGGHLGLGHAHGSGKAGCLMRPKVNRFRWLPAASAG